MVAASSSVLLEAPKLNRDIYAKLDLVQNNACIGVYVICSPPGERRSERPTICGVLQASNRKQNVETRKLSNAWLSITPSSNT
jgi:hypothetical protein